MNAAVKNKGGSTVLWWIGWIVLTIVSFFVSCAFWTGFIAKHVGNMNTPHAPLLWVTAVFGSWMVLLVPLIVVMYSKVDKAYEDTRMARESTAAQKSQSENGVRTVEVEESSRRLKKELSDKLKKVQPAVPRGHLVTAILKDGRRVEHVFILDRKEALGVYGRGQLDFKLADIVDVAPADLGRLPSFTVEGWLCFDEAKNSAIMPS